LQFRYRGSRRESAVAQLSTLGIVSHFMRIQHIITYVAILAATLFSVGCSKSSSQKQVVVAPKTKIDLGSFVLLAQTPTNFSLGAGRSCTIVGKQVPSGMELKLDFYSTNADGTVEHQSEGDSTVQGQQMAYRVWGTMIFMKPTVKTP
jgi:hypothetical protein